MSNVSTIEWTDATWNPVRGCTKVSPGCTHCYAERFANRFKGVEGHPYEDGFELRLVPESLGDPSRWKKPRRIFVCSMSDLFHESVPMVYIERVFEVMAFNQRHVYQVLTKRARRMRTFVDSWGRTSTAIAPLLWPALWVGVSVEDRTRGVPRIDDLRQIIGPCVRFLSVEPLLEDIGPLDLTNIDWVIVGGESGPGARVMKPEWVANVHDQCIAAGVPFFFKQWGGIHKKARGRKWRGQEWNEMPVQAAARA
jgi:protein gp37